MSKKNFPFIDIMRIIAAILVIGIHTYPLLQISPSLDFLTTRIIGRLAVPFFLMTTAFFLFQNGLPKQKQLKKTLLKLFIIYSLSMIIYIPIQIYNHSFKLIPIDILKDIFINGTFYHLWYLPAVMIGIMIVYVLNRYLTVKQSLIIVILLYIIGLGGDSYSKAITQIPLFQTLYTFLFQCFQYTRNGFFFAPLFIWLGAYIASHPHKISRKHWYLICFFSFLMMSLETIVLHQFSIPRHDTMTFFLPITMYFFFMILISYRGKRYPLCKDLSLNVYIIHPLIIIIVRMIGKYCHMENIFIENYLIHFIYVTILSFLCSYVLIFYTKRRNET